MKAHYSKKFEAYGANPQGVDWGNNEDDNKARMEAMLELIKNKSTATRILDVGCGYGEFHKYLKQHLKANFKYTGIDLCENMIIQAKKTFPSSVFICGDFLKYKFKDKKYDYIFCNGIFTQKLSANSFEMNEYLKRFLKKMDNLSEIGFTFNVMSSYSNYYADNLYYLSPAELFSYLLFNISNKVKINHSYKPYEFFCYVYKQ